MEGTSHTVNRNVWAKSTDPYPSEKFGEYVKPFSDQLASLSLFLALSLSLSPSVSLWSVGSTPSCCDVGSSAPQSSTLCHSCGFPYTFLNPFKDPRVLGPCFYVFLQGSCCSVSSPLSAWDALEGSLLQAAVSDSVAEYLIFLVILFQSIGLLFCSRTQFILIILCSSHIESRHQV